MQSSICETCEKGEFQDASGKDACKACPAGWQGSAKASSSCGQCERGQASSTGSVYAHTASLDDMRKKRRVQNAKHAQRGGMEFLLLLVRAAPRALPR